MSQINKVNSSSRQLADKSVSVKHIICLLLLPTAAFFNCLQRTRKTENRTVFRRRAAAGEKRISLEQRQNAEII